MSIAIQVKKSAIVNANSFGLIIKVGYVAAVSISWTLMIKCPGKFPFCLAGFFSGVLPTSSVIVCNGINNL